MMMRAFAVHVCTPNTHFLLSLFIFVMYNGTLKKNKKTKKKQKTFSLSLSSYLDYFIVVSNKKSKTERQTVQILMLTLSCLFWIYHFC